MTQSSNPRREFVKKAAYVTPAIITLAALPSYAKAGSGKPVDNSNNGNNSNSVPDGNNGRNGTGNSGNGNGNTGSGNNGSGIGNVSSVSTEKYRAFIRH
jgi:hypothetical protein